MMVFIISRMMVFIIFIHKHIPYSMQNGRHLDILLFSFKVDLDASFKAKYSFEFSAQERGIKG